MSNKTMLTDLYQLTMVAAYQHNKEDGVATFDLFIRGLPEGWSYYIANGIESAVDYLTNLRFEQQDLEYLISTKTLPLSCIESLKDFRFEGDVYAVKEGTPVFPNEPILRVTAKRTQAQYAESALLNIINFQTMIASIASRMVNAAKGKSIVEFGLRRAQGEDASLIGARAAYIAGAVVTSNVKAGQLYGIPISGTMAHSFVMSFDSEIEAFRKYAGAFPNSSTLLIDTYDTAQGAINAAIVGKELEENGGRLNAVRLDSGDIADLSFQVRGILDDAGLGYVKIFASNDLDEYKIHRLISDGCPIDGFGVGTSLITARPVAAISGVYKLVDDYSGPKIKLSEGKITLPGKKQIFRITGEHERYCGDIIALETEQISGTPLLELVVKDGKRISQPRSISETRSYCLNEISKLPDSLKCINGSRKYHVENSPELNCLVSELKAKYGGRQND